jgi:hypothetical protein
MHEFGEGQNMQLIDTNDPELRRKAAKHYTRMAKQAQRQVKRRMAIEAFFRTPRFSFSDMILVALTSAVLATGWVAYFVR